MRSLDLRIALGALFFFTSCAHLAVSDPPKPEAVVAYRSVRGGAEPISRAGGLEFCAANGGVEAVRTGARTTDDWADKFADAELCAEVHTLVRRDPELSAQPIAVTVDGGEAILDGRVRRDADAVAAARDALAVPGVLAVRLRTASDESPAARTLVAVACP